MKNFNNVQYEDREKFITILATIKSVNWNEYFVCQFYHEGNAKIDIFEKKYIRLANPNPTFRVSHFVHSKSKFDSKTLRPNFFHL